MCVVEAFMYALSAVVLMMRLAERACGGRAVEIMNRCRVIELCRQVSPVPIQDGRRETNVTESRPVICQYFSPSLLQYEVN